LGADRWPETAEFRIGIAHVERGSEEILSGTSRNKAEQGGTDRGGVARVFRLVFRRVCEEWRNFFLQVDATWCK
jgi:hypothetical protein